MGSWGDMWMCFNRRISKSLKEGAKLWMEVEHPMRRKEKARRETVEIAIAMGM